MRHLIPAVLSDLLTGIFQLNTQNSPGEKRDGSLCQAEPYRIISASPAALDEGSHEVELRMGRIQSLPNQINGCYGKNG